jgi:hypothetical protein
LSRTATPVLADVTARPVKQGGSHRVAVQVASSHRVTQSAFNDAESAGAFRPGGFDRSSVFSRVDRGTHLRNLR